MPAFVAAGGVLPPGAAGQPPESRDNPWTYVLWFIPIFMWFMSPVLLTILVCVCYRLFHPPSVDNQRGATAGAGAPPPDLARRGPGGLDAAAIATLPLVFYRDVRRHRIAGPRDGDGDGDDALECSVCLLQFDDDDALRLLPTCPHAFHPECIALWLERHATCPLCRASLLDAPAPSPQSQPQLQRPPATAPLPPDSPPDDPTVVLIGDAGDRDEGEDWSRIQLLARNLRAAGREVLPRSNSTGHDGATTTTTTSSSTNTERFALRLPEHVRMEIVMSHRLRHVTSAVESVRVREGSAHGSTVGGSVRSAVARLLSRFAPGAGSRGDGDDKSFKADSAGASSSLRRRENSSRGAVGEEKRSA